MIVPLDSSGLAGLPPFGPARILTEWGLSPWLFVGTVWVAGLYLVGVRVLKARRTRWPAGRSTAFAVGVAVFVLATQSGLAAYDTALLSVHMVQHMLLSMVVPVMLALGAPVTLALRTLPKRPRRWLVAVLHSRVVKVLSFPPLALLLYLASPWALYFSSWYDASLHSGYVHEMMHIHLVLVGSLFFWPIMGVDPVPGRVAYPFRLLTLFLTLPFHAFLGVSIMGQTRLIGGTWYPHLHATLPWLPEPLADQRLAGGILWGAGDLFGLVYFAVLFTQWVRASMREAVRVDRHLDREAARHLGNRPDQQQAGATGAPGPRSGG